MMDLTSAITAMSYSFFYIVPYKSQSPVGTGANSEKSDGSFSLRDTFSFLPAIPENVDGHGDERFSSVGVSLIARLVALASGGLRKALLAED